MSHKLSLRITQASLNQTALDWPQNMANHYAAIDVAVDEGSDMILMPELSLTGYEVNDNFQGIDNNRIYAALQDITAYAYRRDPNLIISVGAPWRLQMRSDFDATTVVHPDIVKNAFYDRLNKPFNVQVLMGGGHILGMTAKANLFNDERGYEGRYFNEYSFRDAEQTAALSGLQSSYGTFPIKLDDGQEIPFGRPIIYVHDDNGNAYIHTQAICEEKWVATKYDGHPHDDSRYDNLNIIPSIARYLGTDAGLLLEIANASPPSKLKQDKHMHLDNLASAHADVVIDTDGLGNSGSTFSQFGHRLISQNGKIISAGSRMSFAQIATTTSIVQIESTSPSLEQLAHTTLLREFKAPSAQPKTLLAWNADKDAAWDNPENPDRWKEERIRNQALWTYDYMRKTGSVRAVNASSGGQDSGYNITLDYVAIVLAVHEKGIETVCNDMKVPYKNKVMKAYNDGGEEAAVEAFMSEYLIMYYMPTNNNSDDHEKGARVLSEGGIDENGQAFKGLGGRFVIRSIQDLVTMSAFVFGTVNTGDINLERRQQIMIELSDFVHANPNKYTPDEMQTWAARLQKEYPELEAVTSVALPGQSIAYENFQARLRTVIIWAAANVHGGSPRANPNLTEGYTNNTTAAGDLQGGGFNPNGGLFKDDEQELLKYLEEKGIPGIIPPIKALSVINGNEPSAGLLPMEKGEVVQNDEDTMQATMPQLSALGRLIHHTKIPSDNGARDPNVSEVYNLARDMLEFEKLDENQLFNTVANFYRRWYSGQFKIHMGTIQPTFGENVDHQTSRRTPNLNGQSRDEIVQLGVNLMFDWSDRNDPHWNTSTYKELSARAWQDKEFVGEFMDAIYNTAPDCPNMHYNLKSLYKKILQTGWDSVFTPLSENHPLALSHGEPS